MNIFAGRENSLIAPVAIWERYNIVHQLSNKLPYEGPMQITQQIFSIGVFDAWLG